MVAADGCCKVYKLDVVWLTTISDTFYIGVVYWLAQVGSMNHNE